MKRKILMLGLAFVIVSAPFLFEEKSKSNPYIMENVEALTSGDEGQFLTIYNREEGKCSIYVGAGGKIKVFGVGILKANAEGYISFDGKVVCRSGGDASCTPVECKDLYEIIGN